MDIDEDFETSRRDEVINYLLEKYQGHAARICSYGLYKFDNLLNDLFKVCGLALADKKDPEKVEKDAETVEKQKSIKKVMKQYIDDETGDFDVDAAMKDEEIQKINQKYDHIIKHFVMLYRKIRFYGTHAAGVAITGGKITDYAAIERRSKDMYTTSYDLIDIEEINVIKFDMLGLRTMSILRELRNMTGKEHYFDYSILEDQNIYKEFAKGNTDGIFQFESKGAKKVLDIIQPDNVEDIIAANALNRPAPLKSGMVDQYAENKESFLNHTENKNKDSIFFPYTKETYGTFIYQEQVQKICVEMAGLTWEKADKIMKFMKKPLSALSDEERKKKMKEAAELEKEFVSGAVKHGYDAEESKETFNKLLTYGFNKGHKMCVQYH